MTCAYTFTADERFWAAEKGRCLIVSACSGHGYKFGAAVGRRVAAAVGSGDVEGLGAGCAPRPPDAISCKTGLTSAGTRSAGSASPKG